MSYGKRKLYLKGSKYFYCYVLLIMSVKNRLWILMGKKLSGSITDLESLELDKLFQIYPDVWYAYEILIGVDDKEIIPDAFIKEIQALLANNDTEDTIESVLSKTVRKPIFPLSTN